MAKSTDFPQAIYDLLMTAIHERKEIRLDFDNARDCWRARRAIYGLRRTLIDEGHPAAGELAALHIQHNRESFTLFLYTEEHDTAIAAIDRVLATLPKPAVAPEGNQPEAEPVPLTSLEDVIEGVLGGAGGSSPPKGT